MRIAHGLIALSVAAMAALSSSCTQGSIPASGASATYNSGLIWCTFRVDLDDVASAPTVGALFPTDVCWGHCKTVVNATPTPDPICTAANDSYTYNDLRFAPSAVNVIITATDCSYQCTGFKIAVAPGDKAEKREPK
jgi:hypothetical protein